MASFLPHQYTVSPHNVFARLQIPFGILLALSIDDLPLLLLANLLTEFQAHISSTHSRSPQDSSAILIPTTNIRSPIKPFQVGKL
jgi:hypothetical protein